MYKLIILFCFSFQVNAQKTPLRLITKDIPNRLVFYVINENEQDFDVQITISGTNFRQSQARPRWVRVPGGSKVHLKNIFLLRGKKPNYVYDLKVNDSLSNRALKKDFERVKIKPKKSITLYINTICNACDRIKQALEHSNYKFDFIRLTEKPEIKNRLKDYLPEIDDIKTPIINIGGRLFTQIITYDELLEELNK
ncbi:MAG: glutaredoxin domain-containing protein [Algibacter sp.]